LPLLLERRERHLTQVRESMRIRSSSGFSAACSRKACRYHRLWLSSLVLILFICALTRVGHAQRAAGLVSVPLDSASISGTVLDANGAALSGAQVMLATPHGARVRTQLSGSNGEFAFDELPAGTFKLTVTSPGMESFVSAEIVLRAGERRELSQISLAVTGATTEVDVVVTQTDLAQEQIKAAEHQRVLGILPNFYSSYIWDAAPLNAKQKFNLALHAITDPMEFVGTGVVAGAEQANNTFSGYGQGAQGYAKRYGAAYADDAIGKTIGSAILPSLLHQDPRYFYKGSGSVRSRMFYAFSRAVVTRGDNGRQEPNYSRVLGSFAAGGIANLYYPAGDRGVGLTLGNALVGTAGNAFDNLIREFFLRRLTPKVPAYENGKP
jgi:hypothetical protein